MLGRATYVMSVIFLVSFYGFIGYKTIHKNDTSTVAASLASLSADSSAKEDKKSSQDYGVARAQIALAEYNKGIREETKGCNCGPEINKYTEGLEKQWCAMFATWVFNQAGTPVRGAGKPWKVTKTRNIAPYLEKNGTWHSKEEIIADDLTPQVGDVMLFWRGNFEGDLGHADIVVAVNEDKPGFASLVGGNIDDKVTFRDNYYYKNHYGLLGFGRIDQP